MALTRTAGPTNPNSSASSQSTYTITSAITCTAGNSVFICPIVVIDPGTTVTITGATLGGVTMTASGAQIRNVACKSNLQWFSLVGHSLTGAQTLVVTLGGAEGFGCSAVAFEYSGSVPPFVDKFAYAQGSGPNPSVGLTGVTPHAAVLGAVATQFSEPSAGSGFTYFDLVNNFVADGSEYVDDIGGTGGAVSVAFTGSDLGFAVAGLSITDVTSSPAASIAWVRA